MRPRGRSCGDSADIITWTGLSYSDVSGHCHLQTERRSVIHITHKYLDRQ